MALPLPQLPQSVHDVTVDNTLSKPIYRSQLDLPGLRLRRAAPAAVRAVGLYAQAQDLAFYQATSLPA